MLINITVLNVKKPRNIWPLNVVGRELQLFWWNKTYENQLISLSWNFQRKLMIVQLFKKSPPITEYECFLLHSYKSPLQGTLIMSLIIPVHYFPHYFFMIHFNILLSPMAGFSTWSLPLMFLDKIFKCISYFSYAWSIKAI